MRTKLSPFYPLLFAGAALALPSAALAHPVTIDGTGSEWLTRLPNADNLGLVARTATAQGEFIWRDAAADTRTDLATPEVVADMIAFQVTGDPTGVSFLVRRAPGVNLAGAPIQVQIAIDTDRVSGSGQTFFAEFADTTVAPAAQWERLVETLFGSGGTAKVIDTNFNQVAMVPAKQGATGDVEIQVPWSALGLMGPPTAPLRFTVATFRAQANDLTIDIGGAMYSNALDAVTDYGDPAASNYPNTYAEVQDQVVNYSFDLYFNATGEVYAPLVVQRFMENASGNGANEWYAVKNVSPAAISLAGFKLGDEETPDGNEGMLGFPAAMLAPGATFTVASSGSAYQAFFGKAPDAELPPGASAMVPDMVPYLPWTAGAAGTMSLQNGGDELLLLGPSNEILDIAVYGNGVYTGVTPFLPAPGIDDVLTRDAMSSDTDNCQTDFSNAGSACMNDAQCGGICKQCSGNVCGNKAQGAACPDANPCNGDEVCDGKGACVAGMAPPCDDKNPCTTDSCTVAMGCMHTNVMPGTSCADADVCNGMEVCDANGACMAGKALDCNDADPCTLDMCDAAKGCSNPQAPPGTSCSDGDACNGAETCDANGMCAPGMMLDCDDKNPCTTDSCDPMGGCKHADAMDGTPCADADKCNGDEVCAAGQCAPGMPLDCDDKNACTVDGCDPMTGCTNANAMQGAMCDDGDPCTMNDTCDGMGKCVPGAGGCGTGGSGGMSSGGAAGAGGMTSGGTGGAGGSTTSTPNGGAGGSATGGSAGAGGSNKIDQGGCGCRAAGEDDRSSSLGWLATLALAAGFARRRRRG
jgi:MYXO-CTERM domain-containing protein